MTAVSLPHHCHLRPHPPAALPAAEAHRLLGGPPSPSCVCGAKKPLDSGWGLERCAFFRLLERLLEVPGAARLVLNFLGELDQEPELEQDPNVIAVLLSTKLGEEELECSASLVHDAAA
jgi:hypothetical protein